MGSSQEEMTESEKSPVEQVEAAREAFEREFERFARFTADDGAATATFFERRRGEPARPQRTAHASHRKEKRNRCL